MKNYIYFKRGIYTFLIVAAVIIIQSCAANRRYSAQQLVTVPDIVQMSKDGVTSKDIISDIRRSHTVYGLKADQLAKLRDEGVQDSVINYMEKTHMDAIRQNQRMSDSYYGWPGYGGFYYGGLGFGWPYYGGYWGWGLLLSSVVTVRAFMVAVAFMVVKVSIVAADDTKVFYGL